MRAVQLTGDYKDARAEAKRLGCVLHVQFHANSGGGAYSLMETTVQGTTAKCNELARAIAGDTGKLWGQPSVFKELGRLDRGWTCIGDEVPGIVAEPFFGDSKTQSAKAKEVQNAYADAWVARINEFYPTGTIALRVGHAGKTSSPDDRGASVIGFGDEVGFNAPVVARILAALNAAKPAPAKQPLVKQGSKGAAVTLLQTRLNKLGFRGANGKTLTVDGDFGPQTAYAVKCFQRAKHLAQDSIVGPKTWHALGY